MTGPRAGDVDRFLGQRIRSLRLLTGMTQRQLADRLDISSPQLSKYEKGLNRLSAGRLFAIAGALNVSVADLFDGYAGGDTPPDPPTKLEKTRMLLNLLQAFRNIAPEQQEAVERIVRALTPEDPS